jgi:hypothetical protein
MTDICVWGWNKLPQFSPPLKVLGRTDGSVLVRLSDGTKRNYPSTAVATSADEAAIRGGTAPAA